MLMVCPNCGSTDIVAIQGQNYCINCGQLVPASSMSTSKAAPKVVTTEKPAKVAATAPAVIKSVAPIINHRRPQRVEPSPVGAKAAPKSKEMPTKTVPMVKVQTQPPASPVKVPAAHTLDLRQSQPKTDKNPPEPEVSKPEVKKPEPKKTVSESKAPAKSDIDPVPTAKPERFSRVFGQAVASLWVRDFWSYSLLVATLVALPIAVLAYLSGAPVARSLQSTGWLSSLQLFRKISLTSLSFPNTNLAATAVLGYLLIVEVVKNFSVGAVVFGSAKLADKRNLPASKWTQVGLNTVWTNLSLDILYAFCSGIVVLAAFLGWFYLGSAGLDGNLQKYLSWLIYGVTALLLASLMAGRLLARNAVVLADYTAPAALWLGWRLFFQRFWLIIALGLVAVVINLVALAAYTTVAVSLVVRVNQVAPQPWLGSTLGALYILASIVIFALLFIFNVCFWQSGYRSAVMRTKPRAFSPLLAVRQPHPAGLATRISLWLLPLLVLASILAAWRY